MRILAVSDVHGFQSAVVAIDIMIKRHEPDILVIAGDITHFGPADWARKFLGSFGLPTIAVNGNCDTEDVIQLLEQDEKGLLNESRDISGLKILGLAYPFSSDFAPDCQADIVVAHVPPEGCNDFVPGPGNIGDPELRKLILKIKPKLVLSGHVHECPGIVELDGIVCINPGPAKDGNGAVIELDNGKVKARLVKVQ